MPSKNKAVGTGRPVLGFVLGFLFGVTVTVIAGVSVYFAEKNDIEDEGPECDLPLAKPDFLSTCSCWPESEPDFVASVHLLTPSWSEILSNKNSLTFKELVLTTEDVVDHILEASNLKDVYNHSVVTTFRPEGYRIRADLELYFVNATTTTPDQLVNAFQAGYHTLAQYAHSYVESVDPGSFNITGFSGLPPPQPISDSLCGRSRLYPGGQSARIIGGTPTEWYGVYPWVVMVTYQGRHLCGGALWDSQHVLTAAHCVYGAQHLDNRIRVNTSGLEIIAGKWLYGTDDDWAHSQKVQVEGALLHKDFAQDTFEHDIAVLKLEHPVELNQVVEPICHPERDMLLPTEGVVTGWGTTREHQFAPPVRLTETTLHLYDQHDCSAVFGVWFDNGNISRFLHEGNFCASSGLRGGSGACQGDSGGPLFARLPSQEQWTMIGIISNGYGCGRVGDPGFYTFVPYYVGWIADSIGVLRN